MSKIIDKLNKQPLDDEKNPNNSKQFISFEYFPPKTEKGVKKLNQRLISMKKQDPLFIDFTWGAGGSTSELTMELASNATKLGFDVNMHLTCTNMPAKLVDTALSQAKENGIRNICALRGDPPAGQEKWEVTEGGFACALDLIKHIKKNYGDYFGISIAGYPEGHPNVINKVDNPEALSETEKSRIVKIKGEDYVCSDKDFQLELEYLKSKVVAGADIIITQLFYDSKVFISFVKQCRAIGINCPILPGIMPIAKIGGFVRMTGFCKTRIPEELQAEVSKAQALEKPTNAFAEFGTKYMINLCKELSAALDIKCFHFYTLNSEKATYGILEGLELLKKVE